MLRREAPLHAAMVVVMVVAMLAGSRAAMLAGSAAMILLAIVCAALARRSAHFAVQCLDLWAMALGMLALTIAPVAGHHGTSAGGPTLYATVVAGWAVWRGVLLVRRRPPGRGSAASVALTVAGLAIMPLLH